MDKNKQSAPEAPAGFTFGYIQPVDFNFKTMQEAVCALIAAIVSLDCARFVQFVETHPVNRDSTLSRFLPAYTLAEWAEGKISEDAYMGREAGAKDSLVRWAYAMIEINTFFRRYKIENSIKFLEDNSLVKKSDLHFGWDPNLEAIQKFLGMEISLETAASVFRKDPSVSQAKAE